MVMSGFEAQVSEIRTSGTKLDAAAEGVKGEDPSGDVDLISTAMRGSQSAGAATKLGAAWRTRFEGWRDDAAAQADKVIASADAYDRSDYQSDLRLRHAVRHIGL
jgi:hypothetical protein